jgi:hypothetical protein
MNLPPPVPLTYFLHILPHLYLAVSQRPWFLLFTPQNLSTKMSYNFLQTYVESKHTDHLLWWHFGSSHCQLSSRWLQSLSTYILVPHPGKFILWSFKQACHSPTQSPAMTALFSIGSQSPCFGRLYMSLSKLAPLCGLLSYNFSLNSFHSNYATLFAAWLFIFIDSFY